MTAAAGGQECRTQTVVTGVTLTCTLTRDHKGPHSSPTYGVRWRDTGEVVRPPIRPAPTPRRCDTDDCTLWHGHTGAHGHQDVLL